MDRLNKDAQDNDMILSSIPPETMAIYKTLTPEKQAKYLDAMRQLYIKSTMDNYDKVIVTRDMDCPIDENSVLFIDKDVEYGEAVTIDYVPRETVLGDDEANPVTVEVPLYDYIVRRVAKSLNSISIAVRKVDVS